MVNPRDADCGRSDSESDNEIATYQTQENDTETTMTTLLTNKSFFASLLSCNGLSSSSDEDSTRLSTNSTRYGKGSTVQTKGSTVHTKGEKGSKVHTKGSTVHTKGSTAYTKGSTAHTSALIVNTKESTLPSCELPNMTEDPLYHSQQIQSKESSTRGDRRESSTSSRQRYPPENSAHPRLKADETCIREYREEDGESDIDISTVHISRKKRSSSSRNDIFSVVSSIQPSMSSESGSSCSSSSTATPKKDSQKYELDPKVLEELKEQLCNQLLASTHNGSLLVSNTSNRQTPQLYNQMTGQQGPPAFGDFAPPMPEYGGNTYHGHQFNPGGDVAPLLSTRTYAQSSYWGGHTPHPQHMPQTPMTMRYGGITPHPMTMRSSSHQSYHSMRPPLRSIHTPMSTQSQAMDGSTRTSSMTSMRTRSQAMDGPARKTSMAPSVMSGSHYDVIASQENQEDVPLITMPQSNASKSGRNNVGQDTLAHGDVRRVEPGVYFGKIQSEKEGLYETAVPPGKMGVKLGSSKYGAIVRSIRRDTICPILNNGDILVGLDGVNISHFPARAVAKLLQSKKYSPTRIIVFKPSPESKKELEAKERAEKKKNMAQQMAHRHHQQPWTPQVAKHFFNTQIDFDDVGSTELYKA